MSERSDYRKGYEDGIKFALEVLKTEDALTGNANASVCIALRSMLSKDALPEGALTIQYDDGANKPLFPPGTTITEVTAVAFPAAGCAGWTSLPTCPAPEGEAK